MPAGSSNRGGSGATFAGVGAAGPHRQSASMTATKPGAVVHPVKASASAPTPPSAASSSSPSPSLAFAARERERHLRAVGRGQSRGADGTATTSSSFGSGSGSARDQKMSTPSTTATTTTNQVICVAGSPGSPRASATAATKAKTKKQKKAPSAWRLRLKKWTTKSATFNSDAATAAATAASTAAARAPSETVAAAAGPKAVVERGGNEEARPAVAEPASAPTSAATTATRSRQQRQRRLSSRAGSPRHPANVPHDPAGGGDFTISRTPLGGALARVVVVVRGQHHDARRVGQRFAGVAVGVVVFVVLFLHLGVAQLDNLLPTLAGPFAVLPSSPPSPPNPDPPPRDQCWTPRQRPTRSRRSSVRRLRRFLPLLPPRLLGCRRRRRGRPGTGRCPTRRRPTATRAPKITTTTTKTNCEAREDPRSTCLPSLPPHDPTAIVAWRHHSPSKVRSVRCQSRSDGDLFA